MTLSKLIATLRRPRTQTPIGELIYGNMPADFRAWAYRTNANYCRTYGTKCAGLSDIEWDDLADKIDPRRAEAGTEICYEMGRS